MSGLQIRPLEPDDAAAYRALMLAAYEESADAFTSTAEERAGEPLSYWVARIGDARSGTLALGGFVDGELIASVALERERKPKTAHKAMLIGMIAAPGWRRAGAGRALLDALLAQARSQPGLRCINLTVTEGNEAAIRLYESFGFVCWGREPQAIHTLDGRLLAKLHLGLQFG